MLAPRLFLIAGSVVLVLSIAIAVAVTLRSSGTGAAEGVPATEGPAATAPSDAAEVVSRVAFPAPAGSPLAAEPRVRPAGVRDREVGFEASIVAVPSAPSCSDRDLELERVAWHDLPDGSDGDGLVSVAPGEHGTAVLLGGAGEGALPAPLLGLQRVRVGSLVEVAQANGTVLGWRVLDVVDVPAGTPFPIPLLEPAAEQRLVLVGCGAQIDGRDRDVYVLARRGA